MMTQDEGARTEPSHDDDGNGLNDLRNCSTTWRVGA